MFYDNKLVKRDLYNRHLCEIFENSLEKQYFEIYLQPKVYLNCDKNPSAEALIRWNHPEEGIETKEQVEILKKADCDMIQGYFYGKPMAIPDFVLWYEANRGEDL